MSKSKNQSDLLKALKLAALFLVPFALFAKLFLIYNYTSSVPIGWYVVYPCKPNKGDLVLFDIPKPVEVMTYGRGYVPYGASLLKPVAATEGDSVCIQNRLVTINSRLVAKALVKDGNGNAMPVLNLCHTLGKGELFVLATEWDKSFDGRYFGVLMGSDVDGCGRKIW